MVTNKTVFVETYWDLIEDDTKATKWYFSIKPLDNWAYQNIGYAPDNILGWNPNNAIGTYPNEFSDSSNVSTIIAQMLTI